MRFDFKCAPARIVRHEDGAYVRYADWQRTEAARVECERQFQEKVDEVIRLENQVDQLRAQLAEAQKDVWRAVYGDWRDEHVAIHGANGHIASGLNPDLADLLIDAHNGGRTDPAAAACPPTPQWPHPDGFGGGLMEGEVVAPPAQPAAIDCWCRTCRPITVDDMRFVVCPDCGNKRCPHANDHRNACTGSNEPGQPGSAY
jgi:hypothetical protein